MRAENGKRKNGEQALALATSISDGAPVDWKTAESDARDEQELGVIRELEVLARIAEVHRSEGGSSRIDSRVEQLRPSEVEADPTVTVGPSREGSRPGAGPEPGEVFEDYVLIEKVGAGGMGVVYRARQLSADRIVALKLIRQDRLEGLPPELLAAAFDRFKTEAQAAARLDHDHILTVYDVGHARGVPFYSMRFVDGRSLAELLREGPLPNLRAATYMEAVARAVQHAHRNGVLHRDLKPRNILVDRSDRPFVADFGLAKWLEEGHGGVTYTGQVMGTPEYMSPEQARDSAHVTAASDVYSLGATLYELLAGRPPFRAPTPVETLRQVLSEEPVAPRLLNAAIDLDLETIALKCLEKEPDRRYGSAGAVAEDLRRYLKREPILARPVGRAERLRRWCRRNPRVAALSAGVVLLLAAVAVTSTVAVVRIAAEKRAAVAAERNAKKSADKAEAVKSFLVNDLLAEAAPERNPADRQITVREALDKAAQKVDSAFTGQPEVEAAVRTTIGETYRSLSLYSQAEPHLREALRICAATDPDGEAAISAKAELARTLGEGGELEEAEALDRQVLEATRKRFGPENVQTLTAMNNLAFVLHGTGGFAEAESLYRVTLAVRERVLGPDHEHTIATASNLANLLMDQGRLTEALPLHRLAAERFARLFGDEHPMALVEKNNLAQVLHRLGEFQEAERLNRELLETRRRVLGPDHEHTIASMGNLGRVLIDLGRYDEAEPLLRQCVEGLTRVLGSEHILTLTAVNNLGHVYYRQGRIDEAEHLHRRNLEARRRVLGPEHDHTAYSLTYLAMALQSKGEYAEAETLFREALAIRKKTRPPGHPDVAAALTALGGLLAAKGEQEQGEELVNEALAMCRQALPDGHHQIGSTQTVLGECLAARGRFVEAESLMLGGLRAIESATGAPAYRTTEAIDRLVALYEKWGKPEQATEWRAKRRKRRGSRPWGAFVAVRGLR